MVVSVPTVIAVVVPPKEAEALVIVCVFPSGSKSFVLMFPFIVVPCGAELASSLANVLFPKLSITPILRMALSVPPFPSETVYSISFTVPVNPVAGVKV